MRRFGVVPLFCLLALQPMALAQEDAEDPVAVAEAALAKGRDRRALAALETALAADPKDVDALRLAVAVAENLGEYGKAETWSSSWVAARSDDPEARRSRARVVLRRGRLADAREVLKLLLAAVPAPPAERPGFDLEAAAMLARALVERGGRKEGGELFERVIAEGQRIVLKTPADLAAYAEACLFIDGKQGRREAEKALADAQKALAAAKLNDPRPFVRLGEVYRDRFYLPADAEAELKDALKLRPNLAEAYVALAATYESWQRPSDASAALETALRINPEHPEALAEKAESALGDFELEAAKGIVERILAVDPGHRGGLSLLVVHARLTGEHAKAEALLERLKAENAQDATPYLVLARVLDERRRWPECLEVARLAVKANADDPRAHDARARFAFFMGLEEEGEAALRAADAADAFSHPWRANYGLVMRELRKSYRRAVSEHYVHRVHEKEEAAFLPYLLPFCEASYAELTTKYGFVPPGIDAHPGQLLVESFRDHRGFSARTLGFSELGATGVCFGSLIILDSPGARKPGENSWARTFHHELAHTMTLGLSKGRVPRWLTEGLSTYEEFVRDPSWVRPLERELFDAYHADDLLPVLHFDAAFSTPRILFAYYQGGLASEWMVERFGFEKVKAALVAFGEDKGTGRVLEECFGIDANSFDREFREWIGKRLAPVKLLPTPSAKRAEALEQRLKNDPKDLEALLSLAHLRIREKVPLDAEDLLTRARQVAADDPRIEILLGRIARGAGRADVARRHYEAALEKGFRDHDTHLDLAALLEKAGDSGKAKEQYQLALETFPRVTGPNDPRLHLARLAEGEGDAATAAAWLEKRLGAEFEDLGVRKKLLGYYRSKGDQASLRRHLETWILIDPFDVRVHEELGDLEMAAGSSAPAIREYRVAIAAAALGGDGAQGPVADLHVRLAKAMLAAKAPVDEVLDEVQKAQSLVPSHAEAKRLRAELEGRDGPEGGDRKE